MNIHDDHIPVINNLLVNNELEDKIKSMVSTPCSRNMDKLINALLSSSLIVLIDDFIHSGKDIDEDGYFTMSQFDNIPLVKFENEKGELVLPVFTNVTYAERLPYFEGFIPIIVPAIQVLEMASAIDSDKLVINYESSEMIEFNRIQIDSLIFKLISEGDLSSQNTFM